MAEFVDGELTWATGSYFEPEEAPAVFGDLPVYMSPVTGNPVEGKKQRRDDLKRTHSRPYEGREQEEKEAHRQRGYDERVQDTQINKAAWSAWHQMSPDKRRKLMQE